MSLLLDTHVFIWWADGSTRLGKVARRALSAPSTSLWLSAASAWEMAIKSSTGRLTTKTPLDQLISTWIERGFRPLPITIGHALAVRDLPLHHSDPFDRILIAQAQCEEMTLVTADPAIEAYNVRTLDACE